MTLRPRLAMAAVWPWRTLGRGLALWSAASRRPGPALRSGPVLRPGLGEWTGRVRIGELGELGGGRDRPHRAARRDGRRVPEVQRRPTGPPGAITDRAEPAGVTDSAEPTGVTDGVEPTGVTDSVEPVGPPDPGKPTAVTDAAELACVAPAPRPVKFVAGDFADRLRAGGGPAIGPVPRRSRPPGHAGIWRLRRPRTRKLGTLCVPGPVIAAPTPSAHPFLPVQSVGCRTGHLAQLTCTHSRRSYRATAPLKAGTGVHNGFVSSHCLREDLRVWRAEFTGSWTCCC